MFTPFLQRDDPVVTGAMLEVINNIYGKHTVTNLSPTIVERNGLFHFKFQAIDGSYYVVPYKSEAEKVFSVKFWKESTPTSIEAPQDLSANIGKHAYNKTNGVYRGEILEVKPCNTTSELTCYVVNQPSYMRPVEAPADNSIVKDEAPKP